MNDVPDQPRRRDFDTTKEYNKEYYRWRRRYDPQHVKDRNDSKKKWRTRVAEEKYGVVRPATAVCEVCKDDSKPINLDHCHVSGKFRGWLCPRCNKTLGMVKDNPELLRKLADYLENFTGR